MIEFIPLSQFSERHKQGWRMVPGYPLNPGDYAVVMQSPGHRELITKNTERAFLSRRKQCEKDDRP